MKDSENRISICPKCGQTYTGRPAISREDNQTPVCSDCGTRDALKSLGVSAEEQEKIIAIIHRHYDSQS